MFYDKLIVNRVLTTEIKPEEYYIGVLCVDKKYRKKGVGKNLIIKAKTIAHKKKCSRVLLDVSMENTTATRFYKKLGFRIYNEINYRFFFTKINVYNMELLINKNLINK